MSTSCPCNAGFFSILIGKCFFAGLLFWNTLILETKLLVHRERGLSLEPQFVLLQLINLLWPWRKWPVQWGSHFKPVSCECTFSPFCPPRAPTHTPSFSPTADNPMGHSGTTEAVWRCSERGLLQVSDYDCNYCN